MAAIPAILGLDIGGANLKAAHTSGVAKTVSFPLWKHPDRLGGELAKLSEDMPRRDAIALTMTGELCDCFETKRAGVQSILESVRRAWPKTPLRIWSNQGAFLSYEQALIKPHEVAAANWLALAHYVASLFPDETALLIDSGSTTTDITYLNRGQPEPAGLSDPDRLASGSLVYTGVRRTPVCAVMGMEVAAELFATMQDAYVWRRLLPENATDFDTADGRPRTRDHAFARLARMRCADIETFTLADADSLANAALERQWLTTTTAIERVLANKPNIDRIVVAGSGDVLAHCVLQRRSDWTRIAQTSLADTLGNHLSVAACAYSVAMLASLPR